MDQTKPPLQVSKQKNKIQAVTI